jgi:hypothetical protein
VSGRDNRDDAVLRCNLTALDAAQRKRRDLLREWLQVGVVEITETRDGYEFHLAPWSLAAQHVNELVAIEKQCCPFLELVVRPASGEQGPIPEFGGGQAIKAFVASHFGILEGEDSAG